MNLVSIGAQPTRAKIREAASLLRFIAKADPDPAKRAQAEGELHALDTTAKFLYPRESRRPIDRTIKRAGRRRLIDVRDVLGDCPRCGGSGRIDARKSKTHGLQGPGRMECPCCKGHGKAQVGTTETALDTNWTSVGGQLRVKHWVVRGDLHSEERVGPTFAGTPHRCYPLSTGLKGEPPAEWGDIQWDFEPLGPSANRFADHVDVPAAAEADAMRVMRDAGPDWIRGKRINGSQRDRDNLTAGQEKRSKMAKRTVAMQREWDREHGLTGDVCIPTTRAQMEATRKYLLSCGVPESEVDALIAAAVIEMPAIEEPEIAEARRRGDLPIVDAPASRPEPVPACPPGETPWTRHTADDSTLERCREMRLAALGC